MRKRIKVEFQTKGFLGFLYDTVCGRCILKILTLPIISKIVGAFMNSRLSKPMIKKFILKNNINLDEFENRKYTCYNEFFTRNILSERRKIDTIPTSFISPCDSKLTAYTISEHLTFNIKGSIYNVAELLNSEVLAEQFLGGMILIFRLSVDDYHRYCYIDDGSKEENTYIKGILHTVQPIAQRRYNIYKTNCREYTTLHTKNFGDIVQIEVGAMMVGKIRNLHQKHTFKRGEEKGYFEFGGSTICLLVKDINLDKEILDNTRLGYETCVKYGERIGSKGETK